MAKENCNIVVEPGTAEIVEKKSRFIAHLVPVSSEEEAVEWIQSVKKEYWDAKHNCYAYVIGNHQEQTRCSDDGEPSQTAGRPMLDVLLRENLTGVAVVVTRYFGGVLLGTGGLVRAYQGAVIAALQNATIATRELGYPYEFSFSYADQGKMMQYFREQNITLQKEDYGALVTVAFMISKEQAEEVEQDLINLTKGQGKLEKGEEMYFLSENS